MTIHFYNHPIKFVKNQVEREFFGTLGFIFTVGILLYGQFTGSRVSLSTFTIADYTVQQITIPVVLIGLIGVLIFGSYLIIKITRRSK